MRNERAESVYIRNLESVGVSVSETIDDTDDLGWQAQAKRGDQILYQGPSGRRFECWAWGYTNGYFDARKGN